MTAPVIPERCYALDREQALAVLESSASGLDASQARERLAHFGPNEIAFRKVPAWKRFPAAVQ